MKPVPDYFASFWRNTIDYATACTPTNGYTGENYTVAGQSYIDVFYPGKGNEHLLPYLFTQKYRHLLPEAFVENVINKPYSSIEAAWYFFNEIRNVTLNIDGYKYIVIITACNDFIHGKRFTGRRILLLLDIC